MNTTKEREHEFTKDIGHKTEGTLELEEMFEELEQRIEERTSSFIRGNTDLFNAKNKRIIKITLEITKQIQSDLLKEVYQRNRNHQPSEDKEKMFRDDLEKLTYICGRVDVVNDIKKLAEEKGIIINK